MPPKSRDKVAGRRPGLPGSRKQDLDREYDKTQLRESQHGKLVNRDYAAHFFRWGFASRFVDKDTRVLDVGCGQDLPLYKILRWKLSTIPAAYVGVDLNAVKVPGDKWVEAVYEKFDFPGGGHEVIRERHSPFDLVSCFEVIEHMHKESGESLLSGIRSCLSDDGLVLLSTPVFDGRKMAANHIHEWTVDELSESVERSGLEVVERFGTFASWNDVRKVCTQAERDLLDEVGRFYGPDVLACFLAPKYPDASRNNCWVLKNKEL